MSVHHESLQFKIFADETADGIADFCNDYAMPANGLKRVATSLREGLHNQGQSKSGQTFSFCYRFNRVHKRGNQITPHPELDTLELLCSVKYFQDSTPLDLAFIRFR